MRKCVRIFPVLIAVLLLASCVTNPKSEDSGEKKGGKTSYAYTVSHIKENSDSLVSDISYPQFADFPALSRRIENTVTSNYNNFKSFSKSEWQNLNELNKKNNAKSNLPPYEYFAESSVSFSGTVISVYLETYIFNGGAHGNVTIQTFAYDAASSEFLNIVQATGFSYQELSNACKNALTDKLINSNKEITQVQKETFLESINTAVFPAASNFERFTVDKNSLTVYYEPYEVAPYSYGIQKVTFKFK